MPQTRYGFRNAVNAFFEIPTPAARRLLPPNHEPMELRHGSGIFAVTAFDFTESSVGRYQEVVLAVIVPPRVTPGQQFPRSAFHPFLVGTSSAASREHAIERWHLPHYMEDIQVEFTENGGRVEVSVREGARPVLDFAASEYAWDTVDHLYQCFMRDGDGHYMVDIHLQGRFSEHEEETGSLRLHDHPFCRQILGADITPEPFREMWMKDGRQLFEELETL